MKKTLILCTIVLSLILFSNELILDQRKLLAAPQQKRATLIELDSKDKLLYRANKKSNYVPASINMELELGYELWLKPGGSAAIRCPSNPATEPLIKDIPQGKLTVANLGCPKIIADANDFLRGGQNGNIPFIISPRSTAITSNKPTIRWNALPNIKEYQVSLDIPDENRVVWSMSSSSANSRLLPPSATFPLTSIEIDYPHDQSPIEPGRIYKVRVTAEQEINPNEECPNDWRKRDNNPFKCYISSEFDQDSRGFYQLELSTLEKIKTLETQYQQRFEGETEALALAHLFNDNNLINDAIQVLENLASQGNQTPGIYRFLGDLYQKIQLSPFAVARYQKAIALAKQTQDLSAQASAQLGLAEVFAATGAKSQAIQVATEAKDAYNTIGNQEQVQQIEKKINNY